MVSAFGKFAIGDKVEVKLKNWKKFFPGAVTAYDEDSKSYTVSFDDGDLKNNVKAFHMRKLKSELTKKEEIFTATDSKQFSSKAELCRYQVQQKYTIQDKVNEEITKAAGTVSGNVFYIKNCSHCVLQILDFSEQIYIDNVSSSRLFIGPTAGSVYFRQVKNCEIFVATKQFRARDCESVKISLYSMTEPVIESSSEIVIYPYCGFYPGQTDHFEKARLNPNINHYANVFDYTQAAQLTPSIETNFSILQLENEWVEWKVGQISENPVDKYTRTKATLPPHPFSELSKMPVSMASQPKLVESAPVDVEAIAIPDMSIPAENKATLIVGKLPTELPADVKNKLTITLQPASTKEKHKIFCQDLRLVDSFKEKIGDGGEISTLHDFQGVSINALFVILWSDEEKLIGNQQTICETLSNLEKFGRLAKRITFVVRDVYGRESQLKKFCNLLQEELSPEKETSVVEIQV